MDTGFSREGIFLVANLQYFAILKKSSKKVFLHQKVANFMKSENWEEITTFKWLFWCDNILVMGILVLMQ